MLRVRPKAISLAIVLAGLIPMLWVDGDGSESMARIATPMAGGTVTAPLMSMLVLLATWYLTRQRGIRPQAHAGWAAEAADKLRKPLVTSACYGLRAITVAKDLISPPGAGKSL